MSLNEETLRKAIREAIKRVTENNTTTTEEVTTEEVTTEENVEEAHCPGTRDDEEMKEETTTKDTETINEEEVEEAHCPGTRDDEKMEEETINEEEVEEGKYSDKDEMKEEAPTTIRESLNKEKGQLIFDRLVKKWCK
jgi:hypothetical protein